MVDISDPDVVQTEDICMDAVKRGGLALRYVTNQTEAICIKAVKQNGYALLYVKNQTEAICMESVKQKGHALEYVHDQTDAICLEALKSSRVSDWYYSFENVYNIIKYPSPQLVIQLLKIYPSHIDTIMTEYATHQIKTYKTCTDAIVAHIWQHTSDLLYRPNNVDALVSHTRWHAGQTNAKTVFLTKS
jgi:hypothetical protein